MVNDERIKISAIFLAAGLSKRMGPENKLLLDFKSESIVKTTLRQLERSKVDEIIIVLGHQAPLVAKELKDFNLKMVINDTYQDGMNTSIKVGIANANTASNAYLICLGDQPFISTHVYDLIISNYKQHYSLDHDIIQVPYVEGQKGNPVCISSFYKSEILINNEKEGARAVVRNNKHKVLKFSLSHTSILLDVDNPLDLHKIV